MVIIVFCVEGVEERERERDYGNSSLFSRNSLSVGLQVTEQSPVYLLERLSQVIQLWLDGPLCER